MYRNPSKRWRDDVTRLLLDRVCTSSQKFQDNLFEANAIPPTVLATLFVEALEHFDDMLAELEHPLSAAGTGRRESGARQLTLVLK